MFVHECAQLCDQLGMSARREIGNEPVLDRDEAEFLEPLDLGACEIVVGEVRQRRSAPDRERLSEQDGRPCWILLAERGLAPLAKDVEPVEVDRGRRDVQRVPRIMAGHDDRAVLAHSAEGLAELRHVHLDAVFGGLRRVVAPERVDQLVDGDDLLPAEDEHGKERPTLAAAERDASVTVDHFEWSEDPEFHPRSLRTVRTLARWPGLPVRPIP